MNYNDFRLNVHSQNGEDGVIQKLFEVLGIEGGYVAELGASNGVTLSNTYNIYKNNEKFIPILMEGDPERIISLESNLNHILHKYVVEEYIDEEENRLDNIFDSLDIPDLQKNFQFLSIDIDGNDYNIWKQLTKYRPKIIVIEADSYAPPHIVTGTPEMGFSAGALVLLGRQKGYEAVLHCGNVFFVIRELFDRLGIKDNSLQNIFDYSWIEGKYSKALAASRLGSYE